MHLLKYALVIILFITLLGCTDTDMQTYSSSLVTHSTSSEQTKEFTKVDAIATFQENNEFHHYEITDLILVKDENLPNLKAVISYYDKKENNSSNLAFIYGVVSHEICFAVNEVEGVRTFDIAEDSQLTYIGDGTVTTSIRKVENNEIINYKISFSYDNKTLTTHFKVESEKSSQH